MSTTENAPGASVQPVVRLCDTCARGMTYGEWLRCAGYSEAEPCPKHFLELKAVPETRVSEPSELRTIYGKQNAEWLAATAMTPTEAIEALDEMDRQMIHAKRRIFREIANVIRGLVKLSPEPPEGMELMRVDMLEGKPVACYRETKSSNDPSSPMAADSHGGAQQEESK